MPTRLRIRVGVRVVLEMAAVHLLKKVPEAAAILGFTAKKEQEKAISALHRDRMFL